MPALVQAQGVPLVSNIAQTDNGASMPRSRLLHAQGFRSGDEPTVLASIAVRLSTRRTSNQSFPDMTLHRGSPHSRAIATLTAPRSTVRSGTTENYIYTAPANVVLSASTTYFVVLKSQRGSQVSPHNTHSTGENTAVSGWSINDRRRWKPVDRFPEYFDRPNPIMIAVSGTSAVAELNISGNTANKEGQSVTLKAKLSKVAATDVTVRWRLLPGTATADDYRAEIVAPLRIAAGDTEISMEVFLTDDTRHENRENFSVELYDVTGEATLARSRATVTIRTENEYRKVGVDVHGQEEREHIDRDFPRIRLEVIDYNVREVGLPRYQGEFTVRLDQKNISDVGDFTVGIYTVPGTAKSPEDFGYLVRELTFPKGELTYHDIDISVVDDSLIEGPETFEIRVGLPTLAGTHRVGLQKVHTFTILSDAADTDPIPPPAPPVVAPGPGPEGAVLVSNTGGGISNLTYPGGTFSNDFATGSHPDGYKVTRVRWQLTGAQASNRFSTWISGDRLRESQGRMANTLLTPQEEIILNPSTTYSFEVWTPNGITATVKQGNDETGLAGWSIGDGATASDHSLILEFRGAPVVAAPANLRAAITGNDIQISWDRIANETTGIPTGTENGYEIQYCDTDCGDDGAGWTHLASTKVNEHPDTGAVAKLYRQGMDGRSYRVRVFNGLHWPFSDVVKVTPSAPVSGCQAPNLSGRDAIWSGTMNTTTSKFTTSSFDGGNTQAVGYKPGIAGSSLSNRDFTIGSNEYRINEVLATDDGLLKVTFANRAKLTLAEKEVLRLHDCRKSGRHEKDSYDFQTAYGKNGTYWWFTRPGWRVNNERTLYLSLPNDRTPAGVNNFSAYPENQSVLLRWNLPTSWPPATKFRYRYSAGETVSANARWHDIPDGDDVGSAPGDEWQYLVRRLTNGTQYAFQMQGVNERGAGDTSGVLTATPVGAGSSSPEDFTARLEGLPDSHDGSSSFKFQLHFSEEPEQLSYTTVGSSLLDVSGATIDRARRITGGSNLAWEITATPNQAGDISISLPVRECTETNAVCIGTRKLTSGVVGTVSGIPVTPLIPSFSGVPTEHDGGAFDIRFHLSAEPVGLSYKTVKSGLFTVTGGTIQKASRLTAGQSNGWRLNIQPSGNSDVHVQVNATTDCNVAPGVCDADGQKLDERLQIQIHGPAKLSVSDATVEEGPNATLEFTVTMSRSRFGRTTVDYATSDGTALAGSDYTETNGTLTFNFNETSKTVSVPVLDDSHDEGSETLTLALSNHSPNDVVIITDATGLGTINNTDLIPSAWISRFGRTVASQVIDVIDNRLASKPEPGAEFSFAGSRVNLDGSSNDELFVNLLTSEGMTANDLIAGTSFMYTSNSGPGDSSISMWARGAASSFSGQEDDLSVDGDVQSGMIGADWTRGSTLMGLTVGRSNGEGAYDAQSGDGDIEANLTGIYPYWRHEINKRISVWGVMGYGSGTLTITPEDQNPIETDTDLILGALGLRGIAKEAREGKGLQLAVTSDAMMVRTSSAATLEIESAETDVSRVRVGLESTWYGFAVTPSLAIGARHDGGDAETGFGIDLGGGLSFKLPNSGLTFDLTAQTLISHESDGFEDNNIVASLSFDAKPVFNGRFTGAPEIGLAMSEDSQDWRFGYRMDLIRNRHGALSIGFETTGIGGDDPAVMARVGVSW